MWERAVKRGSPELLRCMQNHLSLLWAVASWCSPPHQLVCCSSHLRWALHKAGEVHQVQGGHCRGIHMHHQHAASVHPEALVLLGPHQLLHLGQDTAGPTAHRHLPRPFQQRPAVGIPHLQPRRPHHRAVPQAHMDGQPRAELVVGGEKWHHGEPGQQGALAAALPAEHHQLGGLPSLQRGCQDVPKAVQPAEDLPKVTEGLQHRPRGLMRLLWQLVLLFLLWGAPWSWLLPVGGPEGLELSSNGGVGGERSAHWKASVRGGVRPGGFLVLAKHLLNRCPTVALPVLCNDGVHQNPARDRVVEGGRGQPHVSIHPVHLFPCLLLPSCASLHRALLLLVPTAELAFVV
mmetsp:Transcript_5089/g.14212  ORF Transcript_5089/g.14212 Transcript_5089/m.14212 type:complete len:347 (+) Transcript_5089:128-1168(+)